ncbi:MAG TPA: SH3 domain-containing protein [Desulfovibrio sp.]|nr:SH3 domain-containing protein [Desulfovibrio sp.]
MRRLIAITVLSLALVAAADTARALTVAGPGFAVSLPVYATVGPPPVYVAPAYVPPPAVYVPPPVYDPGFKQVARAYVTLRTCPGDGCPPVTTLTRGTPVLVLSYEGPFALVQVPDSPYEGWVRLRHLTP